MYNSIQDKPKRKKKTVKELMGKEENSVSEKAAGDAVRSLLKTSMSKGKVGAIKLKVKMK